MGEKRTFKVWRGDANGGQFTNYSAEITTGMVVLDAIHQISYHSDEPSADDLINEIGDPKKYDEVVFCGYGEPMLKLPAMTLIHFGSTNGSWLRSPPPRRAAS